MESTASVSNSALEGSKQGKNVIGNVSTKAHAAVDSIAGVADEAVRRAGPAIGRASSIAHQAVDKAADVAQPSADWLAEQFDSLNAAQQKFLRDACSYVSANPLKAVGIAFAAGILIARVARK